MWISGDSDNYNHARLIEEMYQNIKNYHFPQLYIASHDLAFDIPIFQYYNFGPYFISSLILFFITNIYHAYIYVHIMLFFVAAVGVYLLAKNNKNTGLSHLYIAPALYVLSPYMIIDFMARHAFSEIWAFCLLPLLFWLFQQLIKKIQIFYLILWWICSFIFLTSHNITIVYSLLFLGVYLLLQIRQLLNEKIMLFRIIFLITTSFIFASFYIIPIFLDMKSLVISDFFYDPNVYTPLSDLPTIFSIIPYSHNSFTNLYIPLQLGIPLLYVLILFIIQKKYKELFVISLLIAFITLPIWHFVPRIFFIIQFPYRLLVFLIFFIVTTFISCKLTKKISVTLFILIVPTAILYLFANYTYSYNAKSFNDLFYRPLYSIKSTTHQFPGISWQYFTDHSRIASEESELSLSIGKKMMIASFDISTKKIDKVLWYKAEFNTKEKDIGQVEVYFDITRTDHTQNEGYTWINQDNTMVGSYCLQGNEKKIDVSIFTISSNLSYLKKITFYTSPKEYRPIVANNTVFYSTCDYKRQDNTAIFHFSIDTKNHYVAIPYFFSRNNILKQNGLTIHEVYPINDTAQAFTVSKNNGTLFEYTNIFFPLSLLK